MASMPEAASRVSGSAIRSTTLRQLSREYSDGRLTFNDYRRARRQLLDDVSVGETPVATFQPPPPPLAAQVTETSSMNDTFPTLRLSSPRSTIPWKTIVLLALLAMAIVAGIYA